MKLELRMKYFETIYQRHRKASKESRGRIKDSIIDWKKELMVSKSCYDNHRQTYIKTDNSPDLSLWQIVADRLKEGFKR